MNGLYRLGYRVASRLLRMANWFIHPQVTGAAVLVRRGADVLVVEQSYRSWTALPGGRVGRRESPRAAAARELREEVGLVAAPDALVPVEVVVLDHDHILDTVHFFSWPMPADAVVRIDEREIVAARFTDLAALCTDPAQNAALWPPLAALLERERGPLC